MFSTLFVTEFVKQCFHFPALFLSGCIGNCQYTTFEQLNFIGLLTNEQSRLADFPPLNISYRKAK